jgi:predicted secreted protein
MQGRLFCCVLFLGWTDANTRYVPSTRNADTTIRVGVEDTFSVVLPASAGTGFSWQLKDSAYAGKLRFLKQTYKDDTPSLPGGPGLQLFYFQALRRGPVHLRFICVRPFQRPYPPGAPAKNVYVIIH